MIVYLEYNSEEIPVATILKTAQDTDPSMAEAHTYVGIYLHPKQQLFHTFDHLSGFIYDSKQALHSSPKLESQIKTLENELQLQQHVLYRLKMVIRNESMSVGIAIKNKFPENMLAALDKCIQKSSDQIYKQVIKALRLKEQVEFLREQNALPFQLYYWRSFLIDDDNYTTEVHNYMYAPSVEYIQRYMKSFQMDYGGRFAESRHSLISEDFPDPHVPQLVTTIIIPRTSTQVHKSSASNSLLANLGRGSLIVNSIEKPNSLLQQDTKQNYQDVQRPSDLDSPLPKHGVYMVVSSRSNQLEREDRKSVV